MKDYCPQTAGDDFPNAFQHWNVP